MIVLLQPSNEFDLETNTGLPLRYGKGKVIPVLK
jgi:hypothetical protein